MARILSEVLGKGGDALVSEPGASPAITTPRHKSCASHPAVHGSRRGQVRALDVGSRRAAAGKLAPPRSGVGRGEDQSKRNSGSHAYCWQACTPPVQETSE
ncbi:MAG: hypothetical protein AMXMBFR34_02870 [Myxococcaceae bacterium]